MAGDISVFPLRGEHAQLIHGLEQQIFPEDSWSLNQIAEELRSEDSYYVGAWSENELVGYAGIKGRFEADLMTMGVVRDFRGQGIGKLLLNACLEWAFKRGCERIFLEVRESNLSAIGLYQASGFEVIGGVKNYYQSPRENALTMRLGNR